MGVEQFPKPGNQEDQGYPTCGKWKSPATIAHMCGPSEINKSISSCQKCTLRHQGNRIHRGTSPWSPVSESSQGSHANSRESSQVSQVK